MNTDLYKGKRTDNEEWVKGDLKYDSRTKQNSILVTTDFGVIEYPVISKTICQFTGISDTNGNSIFIKDIVQSNSGKAFVFEDGIAEFKIKEIPFLDDVEVHCLKIFCTIPFLEVIGNVHDTPELLPSNYFSQK